MNPCLLRPWRFTSGSRFSASVRHFSSSKSTSAPRLSTVHRGNAFEERSLKLLEQTMSMSLKRVGGKEDGGVDLVGWWWLPHESSDASDGYVPTSVRDRRRIRVIGQCKAEKKKMGPNYVRELEGVSYRLMMATLAAPLVLLPENGPMEDFVQHSSLPMVALLISQSPFTKSTILRAHSSSIPFFLMHLPARDDTLVGSDQDDEEYFGAAWCNPALCGVQGLLKGHMEVRWERHFAGECGRPALWWKDEKLQSWIPRLGPV